LSKRTSLRLKHSYNVWQWGDFRSETTAQKLIHFKVISKVVNTYFGSNCIAGGLIIVK